MSPVSTMQSIRLGFIASIIFFGFSCQTSVADIFECVTPDGGKQFDRAPIAGMECKVLAVTPVVASPSAAKFRCHEEPGSRRHFCIVEDAVSANGNTRAAPLWIGGPKGVDNSSLLFVTNCATKFSTLQDRYGVNITGAKSLAAPAAQTLSQATCAVAKPMHDPALKI